MYGNTVVYNTVVLVLQARGSSELSEVPVNNGKLFAVAYLLIVDTVLTS